MTAKQRRRLKILAPFLGLFFISWSMMVIGTFAPEMSWGEMLRRFMEGSLIGTITGRHLVLGTLFLSGIAIFELAFMWIERDWMQELDSVLSENGGHHCG